MRSVHVCSFSGTDDLKGKKLTYASVKARVLEVGRFSVFEATENDKRARIFTDLSRDPELVVTPVGFPWTSVKRREQA